jgi:probable addiction module antidote protein
VSNANFAPYDADHYLETEEAIAAFLEDVMEDSDDDPAYVTRALGVVARARMLTQLANDAGMSRQELIGALTADPPADAATAAKIARALGMSFSITPEVKHSHAR